MAARLPGRDDRITEPAETKFKPLVEQLLGDITAFTDKPFALFGHSMGALLAYEIARRLEAVGQPPMLLVPSAMDAPRVWAFSEPPESIDDETIIADLRGHDDAPVALLKNQELLELVLPILRADYLLTADYSYDAQIPPLTVPTRVYYGVAEVQDPHKLERDWRLAVAGELSIHGFPGSHFYLRSEQSSVIQTLFRHVTEAAECR